MIKNHSNVPMIICSALNEQAPAWQDSSLMNISLPEVAEKLKARAGFVTWFNAEGLARRASRDHAGSSAPSTCRTFRFNDDAVNGFPMNSVPGSSTPWCTIASSV